MENKKGFFKEFKEFISRGNVLDMAVGIIIGGAFTAIVTSLVNDVLMPLISLICGGIDFNRWNFKMGSGENAPVLGFGTFIAAIINFLIIAFVIFVLIRKINSFRQSGTAEEVEETPTTKICPFCKSEIPVDAVRCPACTSKLEGFKEENI